MSDKAFVMKPVSVSISGAVGQLEGLTTRLEEGEPIGVAIICHPHPLHQGTMHNKVVTTLAKTMAKLGYLTVRFNYRGVGASEGGFGEMIGETADLLAVKAWVEQEFAPGLPISLLGFSFGGFIAASVANQDQAVEQLITIAPAVHHADFQQLTSIACPWLLIQGEEDEIVPYAKVKDFSEHSVVPMTFVTMAKTTHFFHGRLLDLEREIVQYISKM